MRLLSGLLVGLVLGCAGDLERSVAPAAVVEDSGVPRAKTRAEEEARAALAERGISFTGASFIEWAGTGDLSVVELFVEGGMPVDAAFGGWTALHEAARNGHLSVVQYLIDQGASFWIQTESGSSVRDLALQGGHTDLVEYLPRASRAELDRRGIAFTADAFLDAAQLDKLDVVVLFVGAGMSVNARTRDGYTALHYAAAGGHLSVVEFLVGSGASVAFATRFGSTALHVAASWGHLDVVQFVVQFLVGSGADVHARDNWGRTALHEAARDGHLDVVEFLVGSGADVHARDINGSTALHGAVRGSFFSAGGYLDVVEFLVGAGADVDATDNDGETPRDVAESEGHDAVAEYLESVGG